MNRRWVIALSTLGFSLLFVVFFIWNFPLDAIVGHYLANVEKMTKGELRILHTDRKINVVFDSAFEDLVIEKRTDTGFRPLFRASHVDVGFSLFSLLTGNYSVSFEAVLGKSDTNQIVEGRIVWSENRQAFDLSFKKVPLHTFSYFLGDVPVQGDIDGEIKMWMSGGVDMDKTNAEFRVQVSSLTTDAMKYSDFGIEIPEMMKGYFTTDGMPALRLTRDNKRAYLEGTFKQGKLNLVKLDIPGEELRLQLSGSVRAKGRKGSKQANLTGRFYLDKDIKASILLLESFATEESGDGFYDLEIKGALDDAGSYKIGKIELSQFMPK